MGINGAQVLANFDIFAAAGGANKAIAETFTATADGSGNITIQFTTLRDNAKISGIGISPADTQAAFVSAGGSASGSFAADSDFTGGSTYSTSVAIDTAGVSNPAPQAVYQHERYGNFSYNIANLTPFANYTVQLDFAEILGQVSRLPR